LFGFSRGQGDPTMAEDVVLPSNALLGSGEDCARGETRNKKAVSPVAVLDADSHGDGVGATWDFSKLLGGHNRLEPRRISEAKKITVRTSPEAGLDGTLEFEVLGRLVAAGTSSPQR
jgi:hypothetical protein